VLDGINLEIARGETMSCWWQRLGQEHLSCGRYRLGKPESGKILVNGVDFARCRPAELRKPGVRLAWRFKCGAL